MYILTESRNRDFEKLLVTVTEEQNEDSAYAIRFLKSSSIYNQIAGFKQKLEDARLNLIVCPVRRSSFVLDALIQHNS
jgi:hypothetical protein